MFKLTLGNGIAQLFSILTYVSFARASEPALYGRIISISVVAFLLSSLLTFGGNLEFIRELATARATLARFCGVALSRLAYSIVVAVIFGLGVRWFDPTLPVEVVFGCAALIPATQLAGLAIVPFIAWGAYGQAGLLVSLDKSVGLLLTVAVLQSSTVDIVPIPVTLVMGALVSATMAGCLARNKLGVLVPGDIQLTLNPWRGSSRIGLASVAFALQGLDILVLRLMAGPSAAGLYAAVSRWSQPISLLANSISQVELRNASRADAQIRKRSVRRLGLLITLVVLSCTALAFAAPSLVQFVLGSEYRESRALLAGVLLVAPLAFSSQILYHILIGHSREKAALLIILIGISTQFGILFLLAPSLEGMAGIVGAGAAQLIMIVGFASMMMRR